MQIIYADILFILNLYITYALLLLTSFLTRAAAKRLRLLLASVISAGCTLVILIPNIDEKVIALSRFPILFLLVWVAFSFANLRNFIRLSVCFFAVNLIFAGLMFFLWYFLSPENMYYNNGIVYFDISAAQLLITTAVCYFLLKGAHKFISLKTPSDTVFDLEIFVCGKRYYCKSLLDTGNTLTDPFSGYPVIIVNHDVIKEIKLPDLNNPDAVCDTDLKFRYVVCSTLSGDGVLPAFKPQKVIISAFKRSFETDRVVVAVTERKLKNGAFGAILPCTLPFDKTNERGVIYAEKNH